MAKQLAAEPALLESNYAPFVAGQIPNSGEGVKAIVDLAQEASTVEIVSLPTDGLGPGLPPKVPLVVDHRKGQVVTDLKSIIDRYRIDPVALIGTGTTTTLQSFIDLTNRHKNEGSAVFAKTSWPEPALTAVIDYHGEKAQARWGRHKIRYAFPITEEFKVWIGKNGKPMEQADFAAFLEEHAAELSAAYGPEAAEFETLFKEKFATPADLIALSRNLEIHIGGKVKRAERLQTGERTIEFVEEHTNAKGEKVDIPGLFMVQVAAFIDGEKIRIPARLRYRVSQGEVTWFYQLYRWEFWLRDQVKNDLATVKDKTSLPTFEGSPES